MRKAETSMHSEVMVSLLKVFGWRLFSVENNYNNSGLWVIVVIAELWLLFFDDMVIVFYDMVFGSQKSYFE